MSTSQFWRRRRVFLTGHTGFKGSWLSLMLHSLGADIVGYALKPPTQPNLYTLCNINSVVKSHVADIRNRSVLFRAMRAANPEIVFHLAAQSLVRRSYVEPLDTIATNVMGTANLLESVRQCPRVRSVIVVTSDKCYDNHEWPWPYRENDPLGGHDPYSSSKACAEIVTTAYRSSFFPDAKVGIASVRSGNVIGGGDWASDRLVPDCIRALREGKPIIIRHPSATRPWQHVLDPLSGYILLAEKLHKSPRNFSQAWNFGPDDSDSTSVESIVTAICNAWGQGASFQIDNREQPHEARHLRLDCSKTRACLAWRPKWHLSQAIEMTMQWVKAHASGKDVRRMCEMQIDNHLNG